MSLETLKIPAQSADYKPCIVQGDTIDEITFSFAVSDTIDLTGATIKMQVYQGSHPFIDIETGSGITIVDSKNFKIDKVLAVDNTYPVGSFLGDLEITLASGDKKTYAKIEYTVTKQHTI